MFTVSAADVALAFSTNDVPVVPVVRKPAMVALFPLSWSVALNADAGPKETTFAGSSAPALASCTIAAVPLPLIGAVPGLMSKPPVKLFVPESTSVARLVLMILRGVASCVMFAAIVSF